MKTYKEALSELEEQNTIEQKNTRWHYLFIGVYAILITAFLVWGFRFYNEISKDRYAFFIFLGIPVIGLIIEAVSLKNNRDRLDILYSRHQELLRRFDTASSQPNDETADDLIREWVGTDRKDTSLSEEERKLISLLIRISFSVLLVLVQHALRNMKNTDDPKLSIPIAPTSIERYQYDEIKTHRADSSSRERVSDVPKHASTDDWMKGLTVPTQILYVDGLFSYEITGYKKKRHSIVLETRFTNDSEYNIKVENDSDHEKINHEDRRWLFHISMYIPPGETKKNKIIVNDHDVPWYDASLKELELKLQIYNADEEDVNSEQAFLLETPPLVIRTEPAEGMSAQEDYIIDNERKVLFESDEVRVIRTGIFDCLYIKDGTPTFMSSTYWEILIENMSQEAIEIKDAECTVNGRNALWDGNDPDKVWGTVPAGKRETVHFDLIGKVPDDDTSKTITSYMELIGMLRMPLEDIKTSSLSFDLNYSNSDGTPVSVRLDDSYRCFEGFDNEDSQKESLDTDALSLPTTDSLSE